MGEAARKLESDELDGLVLPRTSAHVAIDAFSEHNFWAGFSKNVVDGGVFIATHQELPIGALVVVLLQLPSDEEPTAILADVCWTRPFSAELDVPPGIGLKFIALDRTTQAKIRWFQGRVREPIFYEE